MRVLFEVSHPAHAHFFRLPIEHLKSRGHEVLVTSRRKGGALELLDNLGIAHTCLSAQGTGGVVSLSRELLVRNARLLRVSRRFGAELLAGVGGISIAHVGALTRRPSLVFYDTEMAKLQNTLTYPFASRIFLPRSYQGSSGFESKTVRYAGYHELAYLRPEHFTPDRAVAVENGLAAEGDTFFVRVVSWRASHDIGESGWNNDLFSRLVTHLAAHGKVLISSERSLPESFAPYLYRGRPEAVHHVMAFCRGYVGESATMASECAVLGVPSIYAAASRRGYTEEQQTTYDLARNVHDVSWSSLQQPLAWLLQHSASDRTRKRKALLEDTIDVAQFVVDSIEKYPEVLHGYPSRGASQLGLSDRFGKQNG